MVVLVVMATPVDPREDRTFCVNGSICFDSDADDEDEEDEEVDDDDDEEEDGRSSTDRVPASHWADVTRCASPIPVANPVFTVLLRTALPSLPPFMPLPLVVPC